MYSQPINTHLFLCQNILLSLTSSLSSSAKAVYLIATETRNFLFHKLQEKVLMQEHAVIFHANFAGAHPDARKNLCTNFKTISTATFPSQKASPIFKKKKKQKEKQQATIQPFLENCFPNGISCNASSSPKPTRHYEALHLQR